MKPGYGRSGVRRAAFVDPSTREVTIASHRRTLGLAGAALISLGFWVLLLVLAG